MDFLIEILMVKISDSHAEILCVFYPVSLTGRLYYDSSTMILTLIRSPELIQIPLVNLYSSVCMFISQGFDFYFLATSHGMYDLKFPDQG